MDNYERLLQYAHDNNIEVVNQSVAGHMAASIQSGDDTFIAIDLDRINTCAERAIALGHELGHIKTGAMNIGCDFTPPSRNEWKATEWQILNQLPLDVLRNAIANSGGNIWEVADELGYPADFIDKAIKFYNLKGWN